MSKIFVVAALACGAISCGGMSREAARQQVDQLMVLYQENRPKFVLQKQEIERDCGRATALREAVQEKDREQALSPEKNETLTLVKMELEQAEKTCLSR